MKARKYSSIAVLHQLSLANMTLNGIFHILLKTPPTSFKMCIRLYFIFLYLDFQVTVNLSFYSNLPFQLQYFVTSLRMYITENITYHMVVKMSVGKGSIKWTVDEFNMTNFQYENKPFEKSIHVLKYFTVKVLY